MRILFVIILFVCISCSSEEHFGESIPSEIYLDDTKRVFFSAEDDSLGRLNAVKKARQMTDLEFSPLNPIAYNTGTFLAGKAYKGLIYSSVKELETYVGSNVSFYTFMTAIQNPRSKIYTEQINETPYHGNNCKAYYGTVCSDLVSYALGLIPRHNSYDFPDSPLMEIIEDPVPEKLKVADVLWKKGHVALITDIVRETDGIVSKIEISEAKSPRCKRYTISRDYFLQNTMNNFQRIYRYKEIGRNSTYTPINDVVAVNDEEKLPFIFNHDLCVDKGDKSNYLENENVVINVLNKKALILEIYKDDRLYMTKEIESVDVPLSALTYGNYKARVLIGEEEQVYSDFTYWKVVHAEVEYDKNSSRLYFHSLNAIPNHVICCDIAGFRPSMTQGYSHLFTDNEIRMGYVVIPEGKLFANYPYFEFILSTEYGNIICKSVNIFE